MLWLLLLTLVFAPSATIQTMIDVQSYEKTGSTATLSGILKAYYGGEWYGVANAPLFVWVEDTNDNFEVCYTYTDGNGGFDIELNGLDDARTIYLLFCSADQDLNSPNNSFCYPEGYTGGATVCNGGIPSPGDEVMLVSGGDTIEDWYNWGYLSPRFVTLAANEALGATTNDGLMGLLLLGALVGAMAIAQNPSLLGWFSFSYFMQRNAPPGWYNAEGGTRSSEAAMFDLAQDGADKHLGRTYLWMKVMETSQKFHELEHALKKEAGQEAIQEHAAEEQRYESNVANQQVKLEEMHFTEHDNIDSHSFSQAQEEIAEEKTEPQVTQAGIMHTLYEGMASVADVISKPAEWVATFLHQTLGEHVLDPLLSHNTDKYTTSFKAFLFNLISNIGSAAIGMDLRKELNLLTEEKVIEAGASATVAYARGLYQLANLLDLKQYDKNGNGKLEKDEIQKLLDSVEDPRLKEYLRKKLGLPDEIDQVGQEVIGEGYNRWLVGREEVKEVDVEELAASIRSDIALLYRDMETYSNLLKEYGLIMQRGSDTLEFYSAQGMNVLHFLAPELEQYRKDGKIVISKEEFNRLFQQKFEEKMEELKEQLIDNKEALPLFLFLMGVDNVEDLKALSAEEFQERLGNAYALVKPVAMWGEGSEEHYREVKAKAQWLAEHAHDIVWGVKGLAEEIIKDPFATTQERIVAQRFLTQVDLLGQAGMADLPLNQLTHRALGSIALLSAAMSPFMIANRSEETHPARTWANHPEVLSNLSLTLAPVVDTGVEKVVDIYNETVKSKAETLNDIREAQRATTPTSFIEHVENLLIPQDIKEGLNQKFQELEEKYGKWEELSKEQRQQFMEEFTQSDAYKQAMEELNSLEKTYEKDTYSAVGAVLLPGRLDTLLTHLSTTNISPDLLAQLEGKQFDAQAYLALTPNPHAPVEVKIYDPIQGKEVPYVLITNPSPELKEAVEKLQQNPTDEKALEEFKSILKKEGIEASSILFSAGVSGYVAINILPDGKVDVDRYSPKMEYYGQSVSEGAASNDVRERVFAIQNAAILLPEDSEARQAAQDFLNLRTIQGWKDNSAAATVAFLESPKKFTVDNLEALKDLGMVAYKPQGNNLATITVRTEDGKEKEYNLTDALQLQSFYNEVVIPNLQKMGLPVENITVEGDSVMVKIKNGPTMTWDQFADTYNLHTISALYKIAESDDLSEAWNKMTEDEQKAITELLASHLKETEGIKSIEEVKLDSEGNISVIAFYPSFATGQRYIKEIKVNRDFLEEAVKFQFRHISASSPKLVIDILNEKQSEQLSNISFQSLS
ncbi:MAG: hypothetical protein GXN92_03095, partial [Candidatus Micrarchaeota archaeon]|nr:hypothetical protein [Candidatus Micrarchaeota archaeon]